MLFSVEERLDGIKYNIDFARRGWGYTGGGDKYAYNEKWVHFTEVCQHFCPSLLLAQYVHRL